MTESLDIPDDEGGKQSSVLAENLRKSNLQSDRDASNRHKK